MTLNERYKELLHFADFDTLQQMRTTIEKWGHSLGESKNKRAIFLEAYQLGRLREKEPIYAYPFRKDI